MTLQHERRHRRPHHQVFAHRRGAAAHGDLGGIGRLHHLPGGRVFHSSTSHLNLIRFLHRNHPTYGTHPIEITHIWYESHWNHPTYDTYSAETTQGIPEFTQGIPQNLLPSILKVEECKPPPGGCHQPRRAERRGVRGVRQRRARRRGGRAVLVHPSLTAA